MKNDFNVKLLDLPTTIGGFVKETDDYYTIVLNSRMTFEHNKQTYKEETYHIDNNDLDRDCTVDQIETEAHSKGEAS